MVLVEMDKVKKREIAEIKKDPAYEKNFSALRFTLQEIFIIRSKFHSWSKIELKTRTGYEITLDLKNYVSCLKILINNDFIKDKSTLKEAVENLEVLLVLCELSS